MVLAKQKKHLDLQTHTITPHRATILTFQATIGVDQVTTLGSGSSTGCREWEVREFQGFEAQGFRLGALGRGMPSEQEFALRCKP